MYVIFSGFICRLFFPSWTFQWVFMFFCPALTAGPFCSPLTWATVYRTTEQGTFLDKPDHIAWRMFLLMFSFDTFSLDASLLLTVDQKKPHVRNLCAVILGPEMAAPILWAPGIFCSFCWNIPMPIKFLVLGGGGAVGFLQGGGGGEVPILFLWAWGFFRV